jgi:hypothetical protein
MQSPVKLATAVLDGKNIAYSSETVFLIQVGKGKKGRYVSRYSIKGSLETAILYYKGINIGNGYKKRLYVPSFNKPILARAWS